MARKPLLGLAEFLVIIIFNSLLFPGCKRESARSDVYPSYAEQFDQSYGTGPLQKYDLFLPAGRGLRTKLVLLIHGGGWVSGNKEDCDSYAKQLSGFGFAAVSMNYRLANDSVHYHKMLDDIDAILSVISGNACRWSITRGTVALFGYSAGGTWPYYLATQGIPTGTSVRLSLWPDQPTYRIALSGRLPRLQQSSLMRRKTFYS